MTRRYSRWIISAMPIASTPMPIASARRKTIVNMKHPRFDNGH